MNSMNRKMHIAEEAARCLLCTDAPCSKNIKSGNPARMIRAIRFDNADIAGRWVADCTDNELELAEQACIHYDRPIRIKELAHAVSKENKTEAADAPSLLIDF